jgi:hypothetical protein
MSDPRDEIVRIIADAELAAYKRGWGDAVAAMSEAAAQLRSPNIATESPSASPDAEIAGRPGRPASNAMAVVREIITSKPGMSGVDVVKAAQTFDSSIK